MRSIRIFHKSAILMALAAISILFVVRRSAPHPSKAEQRQMDILTGQLFVFDGATNEIGGARTIASFDSQHEMVPYLRLVSDFCEKKQWPKDRPIRVSDIGHKISVIWPLPPEIERQPIRWGPEWCFAALIDKEERKVVALYQGE